MNGNTEIDKVGGCRKFAQQTKVAKIRKTAAPPPLSKGYAINKYFRALHSEKNFNYRANMFVRFEIVIKNMKHMQTNKSLYFLLPLRTKMAEHFYMISLLNKNV